MYVCTHMDTLYIYGERDIDTETQSDIYFKKLVYAVVEADKSPQSRTAGWRPRKELLQLKS